MSKATAFLKQVHAELKKVKWPSREETIRMTVVVIVVSVILGVYIGALDYGLTKLIETFVR